ncbi:hypothetical protein H1Z61_09755 [Bacillus aquiflavi]|uniref:Uncharacterized protein n=1 Tax=Bacillus aquiflavi TaxID=2672567 RepID=A0A6B3VUI7_9BACI|nr:hypothetical protein [Bacillus aquiflavi]MBA4537404.1 hypothetical protein [Bacillus aquiflavi]NEY81659.1 hypothetical protein [Bacillus aquiflavi]UAC47651.1 hypothetical protein K6959_13440 [Bacillus aquiflavi]
MPLSYYGKTRVLNHALLLTLYRYEVYGKIGLRQVDKKRSGLQSGAK